MKTNREILLEIAKSIACLCKRVLKLEEATDSDNQTLTPTVVDGETTSIAITGGNSIPILHNHPDGTLLNICRGWFNGVTARTSWWAGWSGIFTANTGTVTLIPYTREHAIIPTSPDCPTKFTFTFDLGNWYVRVRRARMYVWIDYQVVVNNVVVLTRSTDIYRYLDNRDIHTTAGGVTGVPVNMEPWGVMQAERIIPAGANVEIRTQLRYNVNGVQDSAWARIIGGIRSTVKWSALPETIVVGEQ